MKIPFSKRLSGVRSTWYIWLFPVFAILISGWLFREYFLERGPNIQIFFDDAAGIQPEKTRIVFRGVTIGMVKKVTISGDGKDVIAHASLKKDAEHFAVEGSRFSLVLPKVGFQGVSGIETIFEGTYITVLPGNSEGMPKNEFRGQIGQDGNEPLDDTTSYFLETDRAGSVNTGDAVTYRGVKVGSVTKVTLSKSAQLVLVQINIENKHVKLVRNNTRFWRKVGIQAKLGLFNSGIKIDSLDSLLHGGIDFFTPDVVDVMAKAQSRFPLLPGPPQDSEKWNPRIED